jgi:CDGSH-type Zn-finger protein
VTDPVSIVIKPKGPIVITGSVDLRDHEGNLIPIPPDKPTDTIKLCGCGRSRIRPFCDGAHKEVPGASPPV